jgi:4-aminobutyrate aminotransferase-like enzyme
MVEDIIHFATSRDVAAFIAEPILGVGGIVTPPDSYFQELEKVLDRHDILLVLDEVQTGFGRTGKMWGAETYGVQPSMITLAKALGNGWPISALIASTPLCDALESGDHFSTWGSNPVMCSAALATLDYIVENRLWENAAKVGREMFDRLKEIERSNSVVGEVRGKGLMLGIEIVKTKTSRAPAVEECRKIRRMCAENGLIVGVGGFWSNVIRVQPPLTINEKQVEEGVEILERVLKHVEGWTR